MDLGADGQVASLSETGDVALWDSQGNLKTLFTHPDTSIDAFMQDWGLRLVPMGSLSPPGLTRWRCFYGM